MARIRSIKPEFWTDEKLTECSLSARLLFIGTWNFADDAGNLDRSSKQIKARVFPIDNIDCEPLIQELIAQGLLIEYSVSDKKYLHIQGFVKHQIINRPSKPSCPEFKDSLTCHVVLTESSQEAHSGEEGRGEERIKALANDDVVSVPDQILPAISDCPHEAIVALYHETLPALPRVAVWDERRRTYLRSRWRESQDRQSLDWWKRLFGYVGKSDFLMGRVETNGRKPFQANLEWILKPANFVKIIEGNYES